MHAQRKEPEKKLRLEENSKSREEKVFCYDVFSIFNWIFTKTFPLCVFFLIDKGKESKEDDVGRIHSPGINSD